MANWYPIFSQGGNNDPRRCFLIDEMGEGEEVHIIIYEQEGNDSTLHDHRRVVGIGTDRRSARRSLVRGIRRYDGSYHLLPAR